MSFMSDCVTDMTAKTLVMIDSADSMGDLSRQSMSIIFICILPFILQSELKDFFTL